MNTNIYRTLAAAFVVGSAALLAGCGSNTNSSSNGSAATDDAAILPASYFGSDVNSEATDVLEAKEELNVGDTVRLRGSIGGRRDPMTGNRAIFLMADIGLPACDDNPDDKCPTPWDYCCVPKDELRRNLVTVQIVDENGQPLTARFDPETGMRPGADIVVEGEIAQKDESGLMIVNARKIHVAG